MTAPGVVVPPWIFGGGANMDRGAGAAARLPESDRKALAIQVLAGGNVVTDLADRHGVSRKFVYAQTEKARVALDAAFLTTPADDEVLFNLAVTKTWLHQVIVALPLICHSSYRGVVEFIRDLFGVSVSLVSFTMYCNPPHGGRLSSTMVKTFRTSGWDCMTRSSRGQHPCWPASMPRRPTAICWKRRNTVTPIPGVCICWMPRRGA